MSKITVGISSYNQSDYLSDAIQSALDQTVSCEVIVVDDGSTDGSLELARKYPVKVIAQTNRGMASARNTAIMHMTGEWFLPLDSDDILLDTAIETFEKSLGTADIIAPSFKLFGVANQEITLESNPTLESFRGNNVLPYFSVIRKEALIAVGGYNPNPLLWGVNDYYLWIDLLKRGYTAVTLADQLVLYRTKADSMWTEAAKHEEDWRGVIAKDHPELFV